MKILLHGLNYAPEEIGIGKYSGEMVRELAEQGASVLYYTSELAEVQLACDRVVVIFAGRVVEVLSAADADEPTLMRAAYGLTGDETAPETRTGAP